MLAETQHNPLQFSKRGWHKLDPIPITHVTNSSVRLAKTQPFYIYLQYLQISKKVGEDSTLYMSVS